MRWTTPKIRSKIKQNQDLIGVRLQQSQGGSQKLSVKQRVAIYGCFPLIGSLQIKTRLKRVEKTEGEQKFRSGRRVSCSRPWSRHPRIFMNTYSCIFSISIIQSRRDIHSRPTLSSNCDYFNSVSFRRISPTGIIHSR